MAPKDGTEDERRKGGGKAIAISDSMSSGATAEAAKRYCGIEKETQHFFPAGRADLGL